MVRLCEPERRKGWKTLQALLLISKRIDTFTEWLGRFAYWLMPAMVLVGVWNVFGRFFGQAIERNLTSNLFIELQWYLFSMTYLLGASYVLLHNGHVRVDVVYDRLDGKKRAWVNILGTVLFLIPFSIAMIYFSWGWLMNSWKILEDSPDPSGLPRYPIKSMVVVGFALLIIQGVSEFIKNLAVIRGVRSATAESEAELHSAEEQREQSSIAHIGDAGELAWEASHHPQPSPPAEAAEPPAASIPPTNTSPASPASDQPQSEEKAQ